MSVEDENTDYGLRWTWRDLLPDDADDDDDDAEAHGERFGFGVCRTGRCIEPCGQHGGCAR